MILSRIVALFLSAAIVLPSLALGAEVNVYSARKELLIKPLLDRFTEQTGIKVNLVDGQSRCVARAPPSGRIK